MEYSVWLDTFSAAGGDLSKVSQHLAFKFCRAHQQKFPNLSQIWIKHLDSDHKELADVCILNLLKTEISLKASSKSRWHLVDPAWL